MQSLLGAYALGSVSPLVLRDALGSIICTANPAEPAGDDTANPHKMPDCCTVSCGMFAPALTPQGSLAGAFVWRDRESAAFVPSRTQLFLPARDGKTGNPRAPPAVT
ncbi:hypothetical protein K32_01210 [Kaistia sp. 32K]|uniref:hypothetical protein n=1 Tax=Kaistia sp. 32K TaxID=2795690 RepID=UPI001915CB0E|nr:hypothetical protein [Kaistia sp. 32K]BCP51504.1 hypothetical protein K32_01210 [Kaistia sp. 32K]